MVGALTIGTAGEAAAHWTYSYHGSDFTSVSYEHDNANVFDMECDGNYVSVDYRLMNSTSTPRSVTDWDGCNRGGGGTGFLPSDVYKFRTCEANVGCAPWVYPLDG
ncbi:hypothetical protein [Solicola gregarius]|uniref:Uncharacterized protein n=1 Tax=Solicola gregarius TaxID=2908642 RepID=A0AA46TKY7_9ACTN|nr:hypothetical protein [Solicola gregarius]UYM06338.1 hypothetical protein L0C25_04470 [Solicola gregarius]